MDLNPPSNKNLLKNETRLKHFRNWRKELLKLRINFIFKSLIYAIKNRDR